MDFLQTSSIYRYINWLVYFTVFFQISCRNSTSDYPKWVFTREDSLLEEQKNVRAFAQISQVSKIINTGDLVLRTGNDFTSQSLKSLNQRDQTYSHCGIASMEHDSLFVYHSLGGEWNPNQRIRRDPLEVFAEPYSNRGMGVYSFSLPAKAISNLIITVRKLYEMGIMFDMKFDLKSNDHMYCAEFVYKSFLMSVGGQLQFRTSHIGNFEFVGVDDLFLEPHCHVQKKILYK